MAIAGYALEMWLNLLSSNGGFYMLLINVLKGRLVIPDRSSATFTSVVGYSDIRVELDAQVKPNDDSRYYASLSLMAAKLVYENNAFISNIVKNHWNMEFLGLYRFSNDYQKLFSVQAFLHQDKMVNPDVIVVAFRGTQPFDATAWCTDVDISWYDIQNVGKIHGGFMKALGLQKNRGWPKDIDPESESSFAYYSIRKMLRERLQNNKEAKFILTGHSLGGALAILFVFVLVFHKESCLLERLEGVYTFGQPRVGDEQFGKFMERNLKDYEVNYKRYVYCNDMVPRLPYDDRNLFFKHFGACFYYDSFYQGKVMKEEPNKNYFSLLWALPKYVNAYWELIRGAVLPYIEGPDYREGWFLRLYRVIGLAIPGLSAHGLQDYNNATRLGSLASVPQAQDLIQ